VRRSIFLQHTAEYFDSLFEHDDDPWLFKSRWYESRKRALTLACLPQARYASGYEPGCANGELSATLAARCDHLLVTDGSAIAVAMASARLAECNNVTVRIAWVPEQWPTETFDLIVLSEFGFYLNALSLQGVAEQAVKSLRHGGTIVACHWRRPIAGCEFNGDEVHRLLFEVMSQLTALTQVCQLLEPDMRLDVWSVDPRSVAQREGFA
jgi:SAM-dependent methyltransferase